MSDRPDLTTLRRDAPAAIPAPRRAWATRVALPAALLLGFGGLLVWAGRDALTPRLDVRTVPVVVKAGLGGGGGAVSRAAGWIEPDPWPIHVAALTDGIVADVLVLEGDRVEAGQVVARLVPDDARLDLVAAQSAHAAAVARVERARIEKDSADRALANPVELAGEADGAAADVRAALAVRDAAAAEAESAAAVAAGEAATARRRESERASGLASQADADAARSRAESAGATARAAALRADAEAARVASIEAASRRATGRRDLAIDARRTAAVAAVALREAEAEAARLGAVSDAAALRVARLDVVSPVAGVVMERLVGPGEILWRAHEHALEIVRLYDPAKLQVRVDVPLADAAKVGAGQEARVTVESLPGRTFEGVVSRVVPQADVQKNTVQVKVRLLAPDAGLRPEMLARVEFEAASPVAGSSAPVRSVFAPERLLRRGDGDRTTAWVAEDGRAVRRDVRLGAGRDSAPDGTWVEVVDGLRPGDDLIDADPTELREGRAIRAAGGAR